MKKFLSVLCGAVMTFSAANCSATVPNDEIAIGGVRPGVTTNELINLKGQPLSKNYDGDEWIYDGFKVEFDKDAPNFVEEIKTRENAYPTPGGVFVGYGADILTKIYGTADKVKTKYNATVYTYYSSDYSREMKFKVINGAIVEIICELND